MVDDNEFLTTEKAIGYLHVNLRTVYRLIKAGKIPGVRVGRQWRFRKRDIDNWLEGQRSQTIAAPTAGAPATNVRKRVLIVDDEETMRDMDGLTLIRRTCHMQASLPIIIVTGFSTESSAIEAVNLGVSGYLTKPFRIPEVLETARRALAG